MKIYCDGSGKSSTYGFYIEELEKVEIKRESSLTGNIAEYKAICLALKFLLKSCSLEKNIEILSDSQLAVNQLNHEWSIRSKKLRLLALEAWDMLNILKRKGYRITLKWISRKENKMGKILG